jgi:nitrate reductase molybdenum cofactor assembly chaperone NarJ/NarW
MTLANPQPLPEVNALEPSRKRRSIPDRDGTAPQDAPALESLAQLLEYPAADFESRLAQAREHLGQRPSNPSDTSAAPAWSLNRFADAMLAMPVGCREELYTRTFELSPACVPYVSIHLFGEENFKRGELMAALHARYAEVGFSPGQELPDHLAILLRFAAATDDTERHELLEYCLLKPLGRMSGALSNDNPYRDLLETVQRLLDQMHPNAKAALSPLEQMRANGPLCNTVSAGCHCGPIVGANTAIESGSQLEEIATQRGQP